MWWGKCGFPLRTSTFIWLRKKGLCLPKHKSLSSLLEGYKGWGGGREAGVTITAQKTKMFVAIFVSSCPLQITQSRSLGRWSSPESELPPHASPSNQVGRCLGLSGTPEMTKWGMGWGESAHSGSPKERDRVNASPGSGKTMPWPNRSLLTGSGLRALWDAR